MSQDIAISPGYLLLIAPAAMLLIAALPAALAARRPVAMGRLVQGAAVAGLAATLAAALWAEFAAPSLPSTLVVAGRDAGSLPLALSVLADRLTFTILGLVALLATIIARYSTNYLAGEAEQGRFFRWLALTLGAFMLVVMAGNLLMFVIAVVVTGTGLNRLLTHYRERLPAQMVAHKKLLFSRVADGCLLAAALLLAAGGGDVSFEGIAATAAASGGDLDWQFHLAAWLIVAYTILKSGQFPFHGWLLQVMEAPTPVSALLHAGIVYSGAIAVLRTHELLLADGHALIALAVVGLVTAVVASLAMLTQTAIKSSLAWSTAGQLGFMLLELGLGLFVLAVLHLIAHSLYKAHAFLSSGSMVDVLRSPKARSRRTVGPAVWAGAVALGVPMTFAMGAAWGITLANESALLAIGTIVAVAVAQLLLTGWTTTAPVLRLLLVSLLVTVLYFGLHTLFAGFYSGVLRPIPQQVPAGQYVLLGLVAALFLGLSFFQAVLINRPPAPWLLRVYVHLYNGLYTDLPVERLVYRVWPARFRDLPGRRGRLKP
ncbi:MAG: proton-conducting transporter membrane subunit [Gammaproteobacteria bacterium]|nr:proton-conducting transporter membrane subunit [Gammaproteobacteria bacterium]